MAIPERVQAWIDAIKEGKTIKQIAAEENKTYTSVYRLIKYHTDSKYKEYRKNYSTKPHVKEKARIYQKELYKNSEFKEIRKANMRKYSQSEKGIKSIEKMKLKQREKTVENKKFIIQKRIASVKNISLERPKAVKSLQYLEMRKQGKTFQEISDYFGVTRQAIQYSIYRLSIPLKRNSVVGIIPEGLDKITTEILELRKQGMTYKEIGERLKIPLQTVYLKCKPFLKPGN
jgi:DNA-binding CsgD family transcriptional regulator